MLYIKILNISPVDKTNYLAKIFAFKITVVILPGKP